MFDFELAHLPGDGLLGFADLFIEDTLLFFGELPGFVVLVVSLALDSSRVRCPRGQVLTTTGSLTVRRL